MTLDRRGLVIVMQALVFRSFIFFYSHHLRTTCEVAFTGETSRVRFFWFNGFGRKGKYTRKGNFKGNGAWAGRGGGLGEGERRGGLVVRTCGMMMLMIMIKGTPRSYFLAHDMAPTGRSLISRRIYTRSRK